MKSRFAISCIAALLTVLAVFAEDPLGIRITRCDYDIYGVDIDFVTDIPPPYIVGVFCAEEACFVTSRCYPIKYKIVNSTSATLGGEFFKRANSFVQVFSASMTNQFHAFRQRTPTELERYYEKIHQKESDNRSIIPYNRGLVESADRADMVVIADYTWGAFIPTDMPTITLAGRAKGYKARVCETNLWQTMVETKSGFWSNLVTGVIHGYKEDVVTNLYFDAYVTNHTQSTHSTSAITAEGDIWWNGIATNTWNDESVRVKVYSVNTWSNGVGSVMHEYEVPDQTFGPFDTSIGCGYRIILDEKTDKYTVQRAYSMLTNMSNEVLLKRPIVPLTAHDGKKMTVDFLGVKGYAAETNATQDVFHWNGL